MKLSPMLGKNAPREREKTLKWNGWGFNDTEFLMNKKGDAYVNGKDRYVLSGKQLPDFRGYFEEVIGLNVEHQSLPQTFSEMKKKIPKPKLFQKCLDELKEAGNPYKHISFDDECRLLHGNFLNF
jgi:alkyldihydroxyacetonephosphate synthase